MADSAPLLSGSNSSDPESPLSHKNLPSLDETFERCIGDFGWAQLLQALLVSFAWVFDAQQTFIGVFTDADPTWHCTELATESCTSISDVCLLGNNSWAWDLPPGSSIVSEWGLFCAGNSLIKSLPSSSFFMGCLLGGLALAPFADSSWGRKNLLFFSCLLMSCTGILTVFSPNPWIYSLLRFITGFGRATIGTCAIVLSTELVGRQWRSQVGICGFFFFTLGFLSLPAMAYLNRGSSWRYLYLWTSIPAILYCILVHFLVRESPRWLFVRGRKEEAVATLKSITTVTSSSFTLSFSGLSYEQEETSNLDLISVIKIFLEKRWALRRLSAVMTVGFGVGMVYYGMPLALGNLNFNLYWNVTLNALSELPASLIVFFLIEKLNRKGSLLFFTMLGGICSIMCVVMGKEWEALKIGLELVSFFGTCTAFDILLLYTIELFPTCIRNSAVAMVRQALVFGGVFCPMIVAMGRGNGYLSYGVFGVVIVGCGMFVGCLPETKGGTLCDTMEEEENRERAAIL